ncbi:MAG: LacI family DNA-binding transcriptional regulator [Proteobacteria bacterium]|nr:LacI family DNA-binding transcriptional regulator [Pseudomonadota bacterium]
MPSADDDRPSGEQEQPSFTRATVKDVAVAAGVSAMTVSRVINSPNAVSPDLRAQVQRAIDALGYIPNNAAVGFRTTRSRMIGFLMPQLSVIPYHQIHTGLTDVLEPLGYSVLVGETRYDPAREARLAQMLLGWRPSGVLRVPTGGEAANGRSLQSAGIPLCEFADLNDPRVTYGAGYSHEAMGRDIARHLIERGRRRIAVVMPVAVPRFMLQFEGMRQAAAEHPGVQVSSIVLPIPSPLTMEDGASVVRELNRQGLEHDALAFFSDVPAAGAVLECQRLGLAVPGRVAIMGYGNHDMAAHLIPSMSTVQVDFRAIGMACARLLLELIDDPRRPRTLVPVDYAIVAREST